MASTSQKDSPLSVTASVAGILTFVVAIAATVYVRISYLRNADSEYFSVKTSLSWYKTESTFLHDLLRSADSPFGNGTGAKMEREMYGFVVEQLEKLEERLLELLTDAEESAERGRVEGRGMRRVGTGWTVLPGGRTGIALSWLGVRTKALELVKQREALGSRVLFAQMSMISSRVRDQEMKSRIKEEQSRGQLEKLEKLLFVQHEKMDKLESMMYRLMHRDRLEVEDSFGKDSYDSEIPEYEEELLDPKRQTPPPELPSAVQYTKGHGGSMAEPYYSNSSV